MVAECASQAFRPLSRPAQLTVAGRNGREAAVRCLGVERARERQEVAVPGSTPGGAEAPSD
jgi:hypothetical protein